ncbi:MAG: 16S rRNA (guanine(527)-N(7))-methyltransferase RsmG [Ruminococcus sp.]|jgi:16S rRNA (guanine527-N7)-methyltransferase|nr:16S rRNA (guanine(527)-N(7))-methyltransferase RsmG [Ruminococcus sp.]
MLPSFETAQKIFAEFEINLTETEYAAFLTYAEFMVEYNKKVNLTAITEPHDILVKHFLDSVIPLTYIEFEPGFTLLDIGTGAGFPGVPMAIMHPELSLTLMDANGKKITFLTELCEKLRDTIPLNVKIVKGRAEDCARGELRAAFDIVTARAVAPLSQLAEYAMPYAKIGGTFLALKGASESYEQGAAMVEELGGDLADFVEYNLSGGDLRRLFIIEKIDITPKKYPRSNAQITARKAPRR